MYLFIRMNVIIHNGKIIDDINYHPLSLDLYEIDPASPLKERYHPLISSKGCDP